MTYQRLLTRYILGFALALILTFLMYGAAMAGLQNDYLTAVILMALGGVQVVIQVIFFLHIQDDENYKWKLPALLFTVAIVLIVGLGSLWIMNHLNYRMGMSPDAMETYMLGQNHEGF